MATPGRFTGLRPHGVHSIVISPPYYGLCAYAYPPYWTSTLAAATTESRTSPAAANPAPLAGSMQDGRPAHRLSAEVDAFWTDGFYSPAQYRPQTNHYGADAAMEHALERA